MNATISMESIWQMLQTLSLNNQKWISEKLIKSIHDKEEEQYISKEEILAGIDAGLKDMKAGRTRPIEELFKELEDEGYN